MKDTLVIILANDPTNQQAGIDKRTTEIKDAERVFGDVECEVVTQRNLTKRQTEDFFYTLKHERNLLCYKNFVICLMTHGDDNKIFCYPDNPAAEVRNLPKGEMMEMAEFITMACECRKVGQNVLLIIQKCRGRQAVHWETGRKFPVQADGCDACLVPYASSDGPHAARQNRVKSWKDAITRSNRNIMVILSSLKHIASVQTHFFHSFAKVVSRNEGREFDIEKIFHDVVTDMKENPALLDLKGGEEAVKRYFAEEDEMKRKGETVDPPLPLSQNGVEESPENGPVEVYQIPLYVSNLRNNIELVERQPYHTGEYESEFSVEKTEKELAKSVQNEMVWTDTLEVEKS